MDNPAALGLTAGAARPQFNKPCVMARVAVELWLMIQNMGDTADERARAALALSGLCGHSRHFALDRAYPSLRIQGHKIFMLIAHIDDQRTADRATPFDYTKALRVMPRLHDLSPMPRVLYKAFPAVSALTIAFNLVEDPPDEETWRDFNVGLGELHWLTEMKRLRHLSVYLFVAHPWTRNVLDVSNLHNICELTRLKSLSLRIGGGMDVFADGDFELPPYLSLLRISVELLRFVRKEHWTSATAAFKRLDIEELRHLYQTRRHLLSDGARSLSASMRAALPGWQRTLRTLRLINVTLEYSSILALVELPRLTRLDLYLHTVILQPQEQDLLLAASPAATPITVTEEELSRSGLGPFTGSLELPPSSQWDVWTPALAYVLLRLRCLNVLHMGASTHDDTRVSCTPEEAHDRYVDLFHALEGHVGPALSLWYFGPSKGVPVGGYLHLPSCGDCAPLGGGRRSKLCRAREVAQVTSLDPFYLDPNAYDLRKEFPYNAPLSPLW